MHWEVRPALKTAEFFERAYSDNPGEDFLEAFAEEFQLDGRPEAEAAISAEAEAGPSQALERREIGRVDRGPRRRGQLIVNRSAASGARRFPTGGSAEAATGRRSAPRRAPATRSGSVTPAAPPPA